MAAPGDGPMKADSGDMVGVSKGPEIVQLDGESVKQLWSGLARQHELLLAQQRALAALSGEVAKAILSARAHLTSLMECHSVAGAGAYVAPPAADLREVELEVPLEEEAALRGQMPGRIRPRPSGPSRKRPHSQPLVPPLGEGVDWPPPCRPALDAPRSPPRVPSPRAVHADHSHRAGPTMTKGRTRTKVDLGEADHHAQPSTPSAMEFISSDDVNRSAILRLQARLGFKSLKATVTAAVLYGALQALGLEKFGLADVELCLFEMNRVSVRPEFSVSSVPAERWRWFGGRYRRRSIGARTEAFELAPDARVPTEMKFLHFAHALLDPDMSSRMRPELINCALTIKEVLLSGDANRLVAELTRVRVDDLAAPLPQADLNTFTEPVLALVIFVNGILIGVQASYAEDAKMTWFWVNLAFALFFLGEIGMRLVMSGGPRTFFCGPELFWNGFDTCIVALALLDCALELRSSVTSTENRGTGPLTILRLIRLSRLTRLFRIFRLSYMKELNLMMKGLLGGMKTLGFALVLLFFTFYVIAVLTTTMLNPTGVQELDDNHLFDSVFTSMYTIYDCFTGPCITDNGAPIPKLLSDSKGWSFNICYLACSIFVEFGLFNLIVAIYIESTLSAAKLNEERDKAQRNRESLRVAHHTKELLKKFCAAQRASEQLSIENQSNIADILQKSAMEDVEDLEISKEVFLVTLQDPQVQRHMDELDLPPDRAALFDILDADASGGLEVTELITGFLQVRGEFRKSDLVASLLAVRSCQDMVRHLDSRLARQRQLQETRAWEIQEVVMELRRTVFAQPHAPLDEAQHGSVVNLGASSPAGSEMPTMQL